MKIFAASQIKDIDNLSIQKLEISSYELMERAASAFVSKLVAKFSHHDHFKIFCGLGNNGGDGLAVARMLALSNYHVEVFIIESAQEKSPDNFKNFQRLTNILTVKVISDSKDFPIINNDDIIIDALFGAGLNRELTGLYATLVNYLNHSPAQKISIDIPSGLPGEGIANSATCFKADFTYTFQYPFLSFYFEENAEYVGKWEVLDIGIPAAVDQMIDTEFLSIEFKDIKIKERSLFGHKGTFGHALLFAGSKGMAGAAVLSSRACMRTGCGLVTVHSPANVAQIIQINFPEAICSIDTSHDFLSEVPELQKYDAIGIGPGIGQNAVTSEMMKNLFSGISKPIVIDADALNILASSPDLQKLIPARSVLTPHPGEFRRLFGPTANSSERINLLRSQSQLLNAIIVLKGHYTCIALPSGELYFNTSGNSGMATGGSGDVLTGIILSLLAQGYEPENAAITGVFLHGLAGDCALQDIEPESVLAGDVVNYISLAFRKIKMNL